MKRDPGDIVDRLSIAFLKCDKIKESDNYEEKTMFTEYFKELVTDHVEIKAWDAVLQYMKLINGLIWELEWELRKTALDKSVLEVNKKELREIGYSTLMIRRFNTLRVQFKNLINLITDEGVQNVDRGRRNAIKAESTTTEDKPDKDV